ncbi:hypothetical protein C5167_041709 [Papaver somniferum]|nr:hypothetical protein C5167_041709 [Papaver somniferum]
MSYCGGSCGCWSGCICDASNGGCKMYPDIDDSYDSQSFIVGVAPPHTSFISGMG